jgi:hypothetical protein
MGRIPDLRIEQLSAGELSPGERAAVLAAVEGAGELGRVAAIEASNREILSKYPPGAVAREVGRRARQHAPAPARNRWLLALAVPVAALAVAALTVLTPEPNPTGRGVDPGETTRVKGLDPQLLVHRQRDADIELLADGAAASPHDLLQMSYVAAGRPYGMVLSIDGRGAVTVHLSADRAGAEGLVPQGETALPHAYELDDAPGFERFFFVTSDAPLDADAVMAAANQLARDPAAASALLPLPANLEQTSVRLAKVAP